jgi:hypothetical protein
LDKRDDETFLSFTVVVLNLKMQRDFKPDVDGGLIGDISKQNVAI